jgi:exopolysaccharide production protein ExoZ
MRLVWIDYLRGILAFFVMVYHYTEWNSIYWPMPFNQIISKIGVPAVSGFYIISGYSIAYVYFNKNINIKFISIFLFRRFMRLAPLLWVAILFSFFIGYQISPPKLLLNISLLFGFIDHDQYIATGSWSIGNEVVFYCLFPLFILFKSPLKSKVWCLIIFAISFIFAVWAALDWIPESNTKVVLWSRYIHPANQFWLFAAGVIICLFRNCIFTNTKLAIIAVFFSLMFLIIQLFDFGNPFSGFVRISSCLLLVGVVWALGLLCYSLPAFAARPLHYLGVWSYSIYLLHPAANYFTNYINMKFLHTNPAFVALFLAIPSTIVISALTFNFIEKPAIMFSKKLILKS